MGYELDRATMEAGRNSAEDAYFEARPQIDCNDRRKVFDAGYERGWEERNRVVMALQAKLDAVMLEYCPDEMTEAQKAEWARHQQPVSEGEQRDFDAQRRNNRREASGLIDGLERGRATEKRHGTGASNTHDAPRD